MADNATLECITCTSLETYTDLAEGYIDAVGLALHVPVLIVFASIFGSWVVVSGLQIWLVMLPPVHFSRNLLGIIIVFGLLTVQGSEFISNIYEVCLDIMSGAAIVAFTVGPGAPVIDGVGVEGMMRTTESSVASIFSAARDVFGDNAPWNIWQIFYALALVLPYFLVVMLFFSKIAVSILKLMMLGISAPFLIMFFALGWDRKMATAGLKTLLSSMFVLVVASVWVGLLLYGVNKIVGRGNLGAYGDNILSSDYLTVLMLGWLGVALMAKSIGLANSITGSLLSNTAAGLAKAVSDAWRTWDNFFNPSYGGGSGSPARGSGRPSRNTVDTGPKT